MLKRCVPLTIIAPAVALLCAPGPALGHQQWVLPNFFVADQQTEGVWLAFEHALGDQRFISTLGPGPSILWVNGPDSEKKAPSFVYTGKTRTLAEIKLEKPGTYRITANEPEEYWSKLIEGKKTRWVPLAGDRLAGKKVEISKRYWSQSVAYVTVGKPTNDVLASDSAPLELIPTEHPSQLSDNKPFRIRVLANGKPLSDREIEVFGDATNGHEALFTVKSDSKGYAQIRGLKPGRYLLSTRHEIPSPSDSKADAYVYSINLMVKVEAKTKSE